MATIKEKAGDEGAAGNDYTLKHIEQVRMDDRIVGTHGFKLKIYENGTYEDETVIYFNLSQATRGIGNDKERLMARVGSNGFKLITVKFLV